MYNYDFLKNGEEVIYEKVNSIIDINDKTYNLSIVITNKNILLFNNVNKNNPLNGRGVSMPEDYLLELSIPINKDYFKVINNNTIINYQNNEIVLYEVDINSIIN